MPAFKPVPLALADKFEANLPGESSVQRKRMFGCPCAFVNGNMFTGLHEDRLVLRLGEDERARVLAAGRGQPFEVGGRTMREYVVLPSALQLADADMRTWIGRAFGYARALPPKVAAARRATGSRQAAPARGVKGRPGRGK